MIKAKKIKTDKATLLVVEMPEGYEDVRVYNEEWIGREMVPVKDQAIIYECNNDTEFVNLPEGDWQLLGRMTDMTEEQVETIVDKSDRHTDCRLFIDYTANSTRYAYLLDSATKSLYSLLQSNEVYFENKYGKEKPTQIAYIGNVLEMEAKSALMLHQMKWQNAQSKVWDKERTFLFIKVD